MGQITEVKLPLCLVGLIQKTRKQVEKFGYLENRLDYFGYMLAWMLVFDHFKDAVICY